MRCNFIKLVIQILIPTFIFENKQKIKEKRKTTKIQINLNAADIRSRLKTAVAKSVCKVVILLEVELSRGAVHI